MTHQLFLSPLVRAPGWDHNDYCSYEMQPASIVEYMPTYLTEHSTILELRNLVIDEFHGNKKLWATDIEALKL